MLRQYHVFPVYFIIKSIKINSRRINYFQINNQNLNYENLKSKTNSCAWNWDIVASHSPFRIHPLFSISIVGYYYLIKGFWGMWSVLVGAVFTERVCECFAGCINAIATSGFCRSLTEWAYDLLPRIHPYLWRIWKTRKTRYSIDRRELKVLIDGTTINLYYTGRILWYNVTLQPYFVRKSTIFKSIPVVSAIMCRPAPFGLEDALTNVAVDRGIRRLLVLGRDVPQKSVLRRKCNAALVTIRRRRMNAPGRCRLQRL